MVGIMAKKSTDDNTNKRSASTAFKRIDDLLNSPGGGCSTALDRMEQLSWILFLRYLDAREEDRKMEADLRGDAYEPILPPEISWGAWAWPTKQDGTFDQDNSLKGDALIDFVKTVLLPGLKALRDTAEIGTVAQKVGNVFSDLQCRISSGYTMREVIDLIQPLSFQTEEDRHELTVLYEDRLNDMGNAGRNGGQYYTPRPLIRVMIRLLDPKIGEKFYDGACGSGGFPCEAYNHMRTHAEMDSKVWDILQTQSIYGSEVKPLAYMTSLMNCILHGLETPNLKLQDTLSEKIADYTDADRVDVIGTNPPFGADVEPSTKENFVTRSSESAYLFIEHFIAKLREGGRAAIIVKNTILSNNDTASVYLRRLLLERCRLEWILDLPQKVFSAGVKAVVLFFHKGGPTIEPIHYYELDLNGISLGKTRPLKESDLEEFEALFTGKKSAEGVKATWTVDPPKIDKTTYDLSVRNPNIEETKIRSSAEIRAEIADVYARIGNLLEEN